MPAEFKISRFIYAWVGTWEDGVPYKRDDVVEYNGKTYTCKEPHTSNVNFYVDLNFPVFPRWELMVEGRTWKNEWQPSTVYSLGNIVSYSGVVYICTEGHTSGASQIDPTKWDTFARYGKWQNAWQTNTVYGVDDIVKYGGIVYKCNTGHQSAATALLGLENNFAFWDEVNVGIDYKGEWSSLSVRYKLNDVVKDGPTLWICTGHHVSAEPFDEGVWNIWIPGSGYVDTWDSSVTYVPGDTVTYGGYNYISLTQNNTNNIPSTDGVNWDLLTLGYNLQSDWNNSTNYKVGDLVRRGGQTFVAALDHLNEDPIDFSVNKVYDSSSSGTTLVVSDTIDVTIGMTVISEGFTRGQYVIEVVNNTTVTLNEGPDGTPIASQSVKFIGNNFNYWFILSPGVRWRGFWQDEVNYIVGDLALYGNKTYRCIQLHTSNPLTNQPEIDIETNNEYWIIYSQHDKNNALKEQGDIVYYNGSGNVPLSIGDDSKHLQVKNNLPSWETLFITPNVYYVAISGVDTQGDVEERGKTWNYPWRTIKYAADRVLEGTFNLPVKQLILNNKEYMIEEMHQWMLYQKANNISPFTTTTVWDQAKAKRDARYVIDAIAYDISRGGDSQTVATALSYFYPGSTNTFFNSEITAQIDIFVAPLVYLSTLVGFIIANVNPTSNYQTLNGVLVENQLTRTSGSVVLPEIQNLISSYLNLITFALDNATTEELPDPNDGITVTIMVKSGTYEESLPITVAANCAINGDELRGVVVKPAIVINTFATSTSATNNRINVITTEGMFVGCPIQFVSTGSPVSDFPSVNPGQTYYIVGSITPTSFSISETLGGSTKAITNNSGDMYVVGGDAIKDMFRFRNGSGARNMTWTGLLGTLTDENAFLTRRPTGGSYASLDPGSGPNDTTAWIKSRSPYMQNITTFGTGCTGMKVDGTLHNGGLKSMVCNDFTQILSDGIGLWITGTGALCEAISVFSYYNYAGYLAEDGAKIRAANGNSSYGVFGVIAEGFDNTEIPIIGTVTNRSTEAQATVQSAFSLNNNILKLTFSNAGNEYTTQTTNMLTYSNDFLTNWTSDGNIVFQQNTQIPSGVVAGWTLTGTTSGTDSSYLFQNIAVTPPGQIYTNLSPSETVTGSGVGAIFNVIVRATSYEVVVVNGGNGYVSTNQLKIYGNLLGGTTGVNDVTITVDELIGSSIQTVLVSGTVPEGSDIGYVASIFVRQGSSSALDLYLTWSGVQTNTSFITYNFDTDTITPGFAGNGFTPTLYAREVIDNNWYRIWFKAYDPNALNTNLQFRIYPRTKLGTTGSTKVYGAQLQISDSPTFYFQSLNGRYTANANFEIFGAGIGSYAVPDEIRSGSVFQIRITDDNDLGAGGSGYLISSNTSQGGTDFYFTLAQSEINEAGNLERMKLYINSGTGSGQYGIIADYNSLNKRAYVYKPSFTPITTISASALTNEFTVDSNADLYTLYVDQPIIFLPTYYSTNISSIGSATQNIFTTVGGTLNTIIVQSTVSLSQWMPISFEGTTFGGVITDFTYYISEIVDSVTIKISASLFGADLLLNSATGIMTLVYPVDNNYLLCTTTDDMTNFMPIQFTGVVFGGIAIGITYYINDIVDATTFTISDSLVTVTASGTSASNDRITIDDSSSLRRLNPIKFNATVGNITKGTKYYIVDIPTATTITVSSQLLVIEVTATTSGSNLITCADTTGFETNNPIMFVGNTFGNLVSGQIYYVLAINNGTTFTVSSSVGGGAVTLTSAVGNIVAKTTPIALTLTTISGSAIGTSVSVIKNLNSGYGSMTATFYTSLWGGITAGTVYYIFEVTQPVGLTPGKFKITDSLGGAIATTLTNDSGFIRIAQVGYDHVNAGTPSEDFLDASSLYSIEPDVQFTAPLFSQTLGTLTSLAPGNNYVDIVYGDGYWMAIADGGNTASSSVDGDTWGSIILPVTVSLRSVTYGNKYWVAISDSNDLGDTGSKVLISNSYGEAWRIRYLPSVASWRHVAYGNGVFVAITSGGSTAAYSTDHGYSWSSATGLPSGTTWSGLTYGAGKFVAVSNGGAGNVAAYSTNGQTWVSTTLSESTTWADVCFGHGKFVAVSSDTSVASYSFDAITWYDSFVPIQASKIAYGQGVFVAIYSGGGIAYTSEDAQAWKRRTVGTTANDSIAFGFDDDNVGKFVTVAGSNIRSNILTGCRPKGRPTVVSGAISAINMFEPGSNFHSGNQPNVTITDPNITISVTTATRIGNGVLSEPTFIDRGIGYNTTSTSVTISGDGYADEFQIGRHLITENVTKLPRPGDNLVIDGVDTVYKITSAEVLNGTVAPNLIVDITVSPDISVAESPAHAADIEIRQLYSQVRITNHDFLNIGYGNFIQSNYPGLPTETELAPQNQAIENNFGRVFYTSTDQDGNFKVGNLFGVEQATGIVTLSASEFGLQGLTQLRLGGVSVGGSSVVVSQFSTDPTFIANSNNIISTQKAIKSYLSARLTQGGSNTFTGQLTAGTIIVGGAEKIQSTIPEGTEGAEIRILNRASFTSAAAGVDGDYAALEFFKRSWWRTDTGL